MSRHIYIPLVKSASGIDMLDNVHRHIYGDNEEKTNRFDPRVAHTSFLMMCSHRKYDNMISMVRIPEHLVSRATIAISDKPGYVEEIYMLPDGADTSQDGPVHMEYNKVKELIKSFMVANSMANADSETKSPVKPNLRVAIPCASTPPCSPVTQPTTPVTPSDLLPSIHVNSDDDDWEYYSD